MKRVFSTTCDPRLKRERDKTKTVVPSVATTMKATMAMVLLALATAVGRTCFAVLALSSGV